MNKHPTFARVTLALVASAFLCGAGRWQLVCQASKADQRAQSEWKELSSTQGGFSVLMPGSPTEETEVKEFPVVGKGELHLFVLAHESGTYVAGYIVIPGLARQSQSFSDGFGKGFLKTIGEATATGAGGRVVKEMDISFGKDPGKEILIAVPAGLATARAYFIKRRGYQLIAVPAGSGSDSANVQKFLDSFKVITQ